MRIANSSMITAAGDLSGSINLPAVWLGHIVNYSIQLVFTGTPAGNFKLQASNDMGSEDKGNGGWSTAGVTNWTDIADSAQTISAAGNLAWNVENTGYRWVRVVWTRTGSSGSLTVARFNGKGI